MQRVLFSNRPFQSIRAGLRVRKGEFSLAEWFPKVHLGGEERS